MKTIPGLHDWLDHNVTTNLTIPETRFLPPFYPKAEYEIDLIVNGKTHAIGSIVVRVVLDGYQVHVPLP
jgi:hypothetical protein